MRRRPASIAVVAITATALMLLLSAGKAKSWKHSQEGPDVFGDYSTSSSMKSEDGKGVLIVKEDFQGDWESPTRIIFLAGQWPCAREESPIIRVWIDGWRKNIQGLSPVVSGSNCVLIFGDPGEERNNLIRRINHGNTMQIKVSFYINAKFDIRGKTLLLQGEAVK